MMRKRLLLLLKPFDVYPSHQFSVASSSSRNKVLQFLHDRMLVHRKAVHFCQNILTKRVTESKIVFRSDLSEPIRDVDVVITIGGDGTLLHASHFIDDSIPLLGLNSDPTQPEEVEKFREEFDATRSTGYLCAATTNNFEQVLDSILEDLSEPSELARIAVSLNSKLISTSALNDVLLAHPCPATVSRLSFRIMQNEKPISSLLHSRSSGLRVSTAAGSTAAMLSAGGLAMPILSKELQFMVREPISLSPASPSMHGFFKSDETMDIAWFCQEGSLYIDGSHVVRSILHGDTIQLSARAPTLKVYLPPHLLSRNV
ncbi:kinase 3 [Perilla frutescens var. hirtella]|uniref:NADH kinase n=1 Tax=Perilla frutescens var. hirtella TaxID=608512 RepID=A0AAD4JLW8_PERFH|nr:kinase 3 [Perilla frutescens var. hirtella]